MAKVSGLGTRLWSHGYDLSGDTSSLDGAGYTQEMLDVTTLDKAASARLAGLSDGSLTVNGWFDSATSHAAYLDSSKLPTDDQVVFVQLGTALGDPFAGMTAKEATYDVNRTSGSALATVSTFQSTAGNQVDFGVCLTASTTTSASAGNGTTVDNSASSASGCVVYLEVSSLASGSCTVKLQGSTNDSTWTDHGSFTAVTGRTAERIEVSGTIKRYLRWNTSGTFSNLVFVMGVARL